MVEEPLLTLIEGVGGCFALLLLRPLAAAARSPDAPPYLRPVAGAFAAVGTLDVVHACTTSTAAAGWTHAVSTLVGGVAFVAAALARRRRRGRLPLPLLAFLGSAALGIAVVVAVRWLPPLERDGRDDAAGLVINLVGAAGYFVAARLFARWPHARALAVTCVAFGVASVGIAVVGRGSPGWWLFHAVHLGGYLVVIRQLVVRAQRACFELEAARRDLERVRTLSDELETEKRAREAFVAGLAHDLRNPVHAAGLAAQLLAAGDVDASERGRCAARISSSLQRVQRMLEDFLDANYISAGHALPIQLGRCDLVAIAREVLGDFGAASDAGRFVLVAPPELVGWWWAKGLRRALENLVANALKYGDARAPVTVRLDARGNRVVVSVHNWGRPLSPEEQRAIFAPHARTRAARSSGERGWGIGLTLVRGTAEAHGGAVSVRSRSGEGTTFVVDLPRDARTRREDGRPLAGVTQARV